MVVLVKAHPSLQGSLVDFLQALPAGRCGPWVVSGWQGALKDSGVQARMAQLIVGWSKVADNKMLKAAAEAANKTQKGGK
ncbi:hypothetical protein BDI4_1080042 [Burkholderia diffusa]|uniref:hypothetical protein n=1 Tax=Burkholderia diffusa TaxID=488732 RepID=UPI001CAF6802|nr:hypothetical protein [Burkholderia diffusa]CAG9241817.1 hypothetical protein BDI4_1080042 [Burkholderia diffusa]